MASATDSTFDSEALSARIRAILTAPDTDLRKISAKRVRKELERTGAADVVRDHRERVNEMIAEVFVAVSADVGFEAAEEGEEGGSPADGASVAGEKHAREEGASGENSAHEDGAEAEEEVKDARPKKKKKTKAMTDEELARQLSKELNGSSSRTTRGHASTTPGTAKARSGGSGKKSSRKSGVKSAAHVDSDVSDSDNDAPGKKKKKKRSGGGNGGGGGGAKGGFAKEYSLSEPLAALVDTSKLSRPQVVKQIWAHIKEHALQNPTDKREIMCDDKMRAVFGVDKINMFKMNKELGRHLLE